MISALSDLRRSTGPRIKIHLCPAAAVRLALCGIGAAGALTSPGAYAQEARSVQAFDIASGPLGSVLTQIAGEAGVLLSFDPALVDGKTAPAIRGNFTVEQAVQNALQDSGLELVINGDETLTIRLSSKSGAITLPAVKVTGSGRTLIDKPSEPGSFRAEYQESATKTPLSIRDTPQSITVITQESMEARQVHDLTSALELSAGVSTGTGSSGGPFAARSYDGGSGYVLRGQTLDGNRDVRVDGFATGSGNSEPDIAVFESVEVVKGPASLMYGQGSLGGFINMVRKKPQADTAVTLTGQIASYDTYRTEADVTGRLVSSGRVLGRAVAVYEDAGSFIDGVESDRRLLAPSLTADLGENTRALFNLLYQQDHYIPTSGMPLRVDAGGEARAPRVPRSFIWGVPADKDSEARTLDANLRVDHEIGDRWLASLLLQKSNQKHSSIFDSYGFLPGIGVEENGETAMYAGIYSSDTDNWAGELRLDGYFDAFGQEHQVMFGVERNHREQSFSYGYVPLGVANIYEENFEEVGTFPGQDSPIFDGSPSFSSNKGAYTQVIMNVLDRTRLIAGLRYDDTKQGIRGDSSTSSDAWVKRIGATQDLTQNITAYLSYSESFTPVEALSRSGVLEPETGTGYEAGLKTEWFDKRLGATLAVYSQELDNRPISDPTNGVGESFSISAGLQRSDGVEIEVSGTAFTGLTVGGAASWIDAEYIDRNDPLYGLTPIATVDRQFSLYTAYEIQTGSLRGLELGGTAISVGRRSLSWSATENAYIDGYERLDLHVRYKAIPHFDVVLQVRNVTDEEYVERFRQLGYGNFYGSPRAVLVRGEYTF